MFFPDKLVCFRKYKNKQAWLMTRVKAWKGQNTGRKPVICLTLALTQKVIRLQEVLLGMTGQSICKNNNNGDHNVATEKNGTKFYLLFIWCPSRRWSHFNSSTTKVLQLSHFPSVKLHLSIMMNFIWKPRVFHHHMYKISINFIIPINTNFVIRVCLGQILQH